jgi:hypothetical protein
MVCKFNYFLYGLEQASWAWYNRFASYLVSAGFVEAKADTSLIILRHSNNTIYIFYVDNIVLTTYIAALL